MPSDAMVLIVEDNYLVALTIELALKARGFTVLGPAAEVKRARELLTPAVRCAVLDVNVRGGSTLGLARDLVAQGVGVIFVTGYGSLPEEVPEDDALRSALRLRKPVDPDELAEAVSRLLG